MKPYYTWLWCRHMGQGAGERENSVQSMTVKALVAQLCWILCHPMDCSPPVHGILQARILEWVAIPFSRGSSQPRDQTWVSCITGRFITIWGTCIYICMCIYVCGIPRWHSVKSLPARAGNTRDLSVIPGSGRFPWRRKWQPTPVFLLEKFHGQRSLVSYSPWGHKESDTTEHTHAHTHVCM